MGMFIKALNRPKEAFAYANKWVSIVLVALTVLVNTVFEPLLQVYAGKFDCEIDGLNMLKLTVFGVASYLVICAVLWLVCKEFGSKAKFSAYIRTWGMTFFPTLLCAIVVAVTEVYFYVFWNSVFWGVVFNVLFGGILLWKTILYVIYLRDVALLRGGKMIGAFIVIAVFIIALAWANGHLGLITPVI